MILPRFLCGHGAYAGRAFPTKARGQQTIFQGNVAAKIQKAVAALSPTNGIDYNIGKKVPENEIKCPVNEVNRTNDIHKRPDKGSPNSVISNYDRGVLRWERYYDEKGNPYLDIDYHHHNAPDVHSVPHYHRIIVEKGVIIRGGANNV